MKPIHILFLALGLSFGFKARAGEGCGKKVTYVLSGTADLTARDLVKIQLIIKEYQQGTLSAESFYVQLTDKYGASRKLISFICKRIGIDELTLDLDLSDLDNEAIKDGGKIEIIGKMLPTDNASGGEINADIKVISLYDDGAVANSDFQVITSIAELPMRGTLKLFPNPAMDQVILSTGGELLSNLEIISLGGDVVIRRHNLPSNPVLDISSLPVGTYFVKAAGSSHSFYAKLAVVK